MIVRAADRFVTTQPGIVTRSVFSFGPHYDAARVGVGALVGIDEHLIAPGAGFAEHAHRGTDIVSVVLSGRLRHESDGRTIDVDAGGVLVQHTGSGIRHIESNASTTDELRLLQLAFLSDISEPRASEPCTYTAELPLSLDVGELMVWPAGELAPAATAVVVLGGSWQLGGTTFEVGDTAWDGGANPSGSGELLVWRLTKR